MTSDWRFKWAFPMLGRIPSTLPWHIAPKLGRDPMRTRQATERFLQERFRSVFPDRLEAEYRQWAFAHLDMLAQEQLDSVALHRLGARGGPQIQLAGWEHVECLLSRGQGFILVLNHYDRLLTAPIALALRGLTLHTMTMPIADNLELGAAHRDFLMRKISAYTQITRGQWRTSNQGLRPVHEGLRSGQAWVILADAWRPEFGRMRSHAFLGGQLSLPTGIERLAQSTGAALLHGMTRSVAPDQLEVVIEALPEEPEVALNRVVRRLAEDVAARPWAWWQWGLWDQMWRPTSQGDRLVHH